MPFRQEIYRLSNSMSTFASAARESTTAWLNAEDGSTIEALVEGTQATSANAERDTRPSEMLPLDLEELRLFLTRADAVRNISPGALNHTRETLLQMLVSRLKTSCDGELTLLCFLIGGSHAKSLCRVAKLILVEQQIRFLSLREIVELWLIAFPEEPSAPGWEGRKQILLHLKGILRQTAEVDPAFFKACSKVLH